VTFRRGRVVAARFAPDGQTVLYSAAWEGRPPEPFSTRLDSPESRSLGHAGASLLGVSSGGDMLLSLGCRLDLFSSRGTLARAALGGGAARPLAEGVEWADISPDGARLAVVRASGGRTRLEYPLGKVLHETAGWISHARIAPDGRSVAFLDHPVPWDDRGAVALVDEAGKKTVLAAGWDSEQGLAWSPRGDEVWFTAAQAGIQRALYAVSRAGGLRVVARIPGSLTLHDLGADGRVLLSRDDRRREMRGRGPGDTEDRDLSWLDQSAAVDVSLDGKQLLFLEYGGARGPNYAVYVRPLSDGSAIYLGDGNGQSLSPDGRSVLAMIHTTPPELRLLPTGIGEPRSVRLGVPMELSWAAFLPDSRRAIVEGTEAGKGMREYLVELDSGAVRAVTPEGTAAFALSADGARILATGADGAWALYPIAGGPPVPVPAMRAGDWPVRFALDDGTLYLFRRHELPARIERLDVRAAAAGAPGREVWRELVPADPAGVIGVSEVAMSPDGKAFAYSLNRMLSTLYVVRGLR
jgi:Tol biopolymer transport system component